MVSRHGFGQRAGQHLSQSVHSGMWLSRGNQKDQVKIKMEMNTQHCAGGQRIKHFSKVRGVFDGTRGQSKGNYMGDEPITPILRWRCSCEPETLSTGWVCLHEACREKLPLTSIRVLNLPHSLHTPRFSLSYLEFSRPWKPSPNHLRDGRVLF